jgi:hypothetical protein
LTLEDGLKFGFGLIANMSCLKVLRLCTSSPIGAFELQHLVDLELPSLQTVALLGCPCSTYREPWNCRDQVKPRLRDCNFQVYVDDDELLLTDCQSCNE